MHDKVKVQRTIAEIFDYRPKPKSPKFAAGCLAMSAETQRFLVLKRSKDIDSAGGTWSTCGGKVDDGESHQETVKREMEEEAGYRGPYIELIPWGVSTYKEWTYNAFVAVVPREFRPVLNWENTAHVWLTVGELAALEPKHSGLKQLMDMHSDVLIRTAARHR